MTLSRHIQNSLKDQVGQSLAVLARPGVQTFERFERRGGVNEAMFYVLLAALASAIVAAIFAPLHSDVTVLQQFINRLITIPLQFVIFTGAVYFVARQFFKGTGSYAEVTYTFALFFVPLSLLSTAIGWVPVLGQLSMVLISLAQIYYGYLAVQSSMNIREGANPALTLLVAALATTLFNMLLFGGSVLQSLSL